MVKMIFHAIRIALIGQNSLPLGANSFLKEKFKLSPLIIELNHSLIR